MEKFIFKFYAKIYFEFTEKNGKIKVPNIGGYTYENRNYTKKLCRKG